MRSDQLFRLKSDSSKQRGYRLEPSAEIGAELNIEVGLLPFDRFIRVPTLGLHALSPPVGLKQILASVGHRFQ